jgi:tryptophan synthase alpha chain
LKKLVAYITSSLPDKNFTVDLISKLNEVGVDKIELGVPFSDPVADGEIIEKANHLSLESGFRVDDIFEISQQTSANLYYMGYFNIFYHYGVENIIKKASSLGVKGFIIPDLPYEESKVYKNIFDTHSVSCIDFVAPTDSEERIATVVKNSRDFIYMVAYAGITGANQSEDLSKIIENVRKYTETELYVGFGVNEKTAKEKAKGVDGVIVGTAFVKHLLDESLSPTQKIERISNLAREIKEKIN